eukprot:2894253-Pyramimonas_sp.AAC.2
MDPKGTDGSTAPTDRTMRSAPVCGVGGGDAQGCERARHHRHRQRRRVDERAALGEEHLLERSAAAHEPALRHQTHGACKNKITSFYGSPRVTKPTAHVFSRGQSEGRRRAGAEVSRKCSKVSQKFPKVSRKFPKSSQKSPKSLPKLAKVPKSLPKVSQKFPKVSQAGAGESLCTAKHCEGPTRILDTLGLRTRVPDVKRGCCVVHRCDD